MELEIGLMLMDKHRKENLVVEIEQDGSRINPKYLLLLEDVYNKEEHYLVTTTNIYLHLIIMDGYK